MCASKVKFAAVGTLALAIANTAAPATAGVWHGGGGVHGDGSHGGGTQTWHGGGFYDGYHGWRGYGWRRAIGRGFLGGYVVGSALGPYDSGGYDYGYDTPHGYGHGECGAYRPLYNGWGVVIGFRPVYVC